MTVAESKENYLALILQWIENNNTTDHVDFTQPHIKRSLRYVYPIFMFLHAMVGIVGLVGNVAMITVMGKRTLYHDQTFFLLGNLAFSDLIKCLFVLPMSLANMLIQNWIFGSFMCFFLPMIQLFPIHASMLTFLTIAIDRYRQIVNPFKARVPAGLCTIAVWVAAVCVVLPHAVYIKYIDLGAFLGERFNGIGICYVNMEKHIEEYLRAMFVTLYAMPLAIIAFLYVKVSAELKARESSPIYVHYNVRNESPRDSQFQDEISSKVTWATDSEHGININSTNSKDFTERATHDSDDDLDIAKEKRTHNYLIAMVTFFAICWCPLNILILVNYFVHEDEDNTGHIDITYITFSWFGFLSTCVNPILFASWRMPSTTKDRLKGYFRFSNKRRRSSQASRTTCAESFVAPPTPSPNESRRLPKKPVSYSNGLSPYHATVL
ncbi:hypothetical protein CHS0354_041243 [Potamilus streckersoni]|uniref:G-protein coupled receptors family 1 profile domain-containing protein n=1 Tax=Potamilus streckersoni TaxID=2493646 RepID=A0AAE0SE54_9BIVA|nr:hypothetical protein CHS0354_041243 [Potamilus streckersoni]